MLVLTRMINLSPIALIWIPYLTSQLQWAILMPSLAALLLSTHLSPALVMWLALHPAVLYITVHQLAKSQSGMVSFMALQAARFRSDMVLLYRTHVALTTVLTSTAITTMAWWHLRDILEAIAWPMLPLQSKQSSKHPMHLGKWGRVKGKTGETVIGRYNSKFCRWWVLSE